MVLPGAPGSATVIVDWANARRAEGYRTVVTDANGVELANKLTEDSETTIPDLPSGTTVSVTVSARNDAGESQPCAAVTCVVP